MLPLDGLKLLAEFVAFLKAKFNIDPQTISLIEAEDMALAKAIEEGWTSEPVSRDEIFELLPCQTQILTDNPTYDKMSGTEAVG